MLPYCADWRHPSDTLFLIAEEDWRLHASHDSQGKSSSFYLDPKRIRELTSPDTVPQLQAERGPVVYQQFAHLVEPPADSPGGAVGDGNNDWKESGIGFYTRGEKPSADAFAETTQELQDIVKICCEADRAGAGELLWLSWMAATSRRKRAPSRYSGLIAISALGARKLLAHFEEWIPIGCFDVNLRKALEENQDCRAKLAAGYLYPSLGHYSEHYADAVAGIREAYWESAYIAQSTRGPSEPPAAPWDGNFQICGCILKGHNPEKHPGISFPERTGEYLAWWTAAISVPKLPAGRAMVYRSHKKSDQKKKGWYWRPKDITHTTRPPPERIDNSEAGCGPI